MPLESLSLEADQGEQIKCDNNYVIASGVVSILNESSVQKTDDKTLVCQGDQTALLLVQKAENQAALQNAETCTTPSEQKEVSEQKAGVGVDEAIKLPLEIDAAAGVSEQISIKGI